MKITNILSIIFNLFLTSLSIAQTCDCTEYLYLNEPSTSISQGIHKFELNENYDPLTDPPSAIIAQEIGSPWFDNIATGETLTDPHGLAVDLNGNIYIGETNNAASGGIRKFNCDGSILPTTEFYIPNSSGYSFASQNNIVYVNRQEFNVTEAENVIEAFDVCSGELLGFYCLSGIGARADWGLHLQDDGTMIATNDFLAVGNVENVPNNLFKFNINTDILNAPGETNPVCINPLISQGTSPPSLNTNAFARDRVFGIVADLSGFIYIVERSLTGDPDFPFGGSDGMARILKYDSNGVLVDISPYDNIEGDGGYFRAIGIYYSKTLDLLFVSTASPTDDCVSLFDTDLNYLGSAVPSPGDGTTGKSIFITEECCPTSTPLVENIDLCNPTLGEQVFLLDLVGCPLCEGTWSADQSQNVFEFDACNNSITINALNECGSFTLNSGGTGALAQCSSFEVTITVCTSTTAEPAISITDNVCNPETAGSINIDTPCPSGNSIQFSIDGGINWSATQPTYDTNNSVTVRARCVNENFQTCISTETADITSSPKKCCPPENCINQYGEFTIIKRIP